MLTYDDVRLILGVNWMGCVYESEALELMAVERKVDHESFWRHVDAYIDMLEFTDLRQDLSLVELACWHERLFPVDEFAYGGVLRSRPVKITKITGGYILPPTGYDNVFNRLQRHVLFINGVVNHAPRNVFYNIAKLHIEFELLHPFEDGNGRMGRLLMNYMTKRLGLGTVCIPARKRKQYLLFLAHENVGGLSNLIQENIG